jgi:hypothetical protein
MRTRSFKPSLVLGHMLRSIIESVCLMDQLRSTRESAKCVAIKSQQRNCHVVIQSANSVLGIILKAELHSIPTLSTAHSIKAIHWRKTSLSLSQSTSPQSLRKATRDDSGRLRRNQLSFLVQNAIKELHQALISISALSARLSGANSVIVSTFSSLNDQSMLGWDN